MMKKRILMIVLIYIVIATISEGIAFAQDIDVDSMNNEQLTTLLLQILGKLQEEDPEKEVPDTPVETTVIPLADPAKIEEIIQITIYDNKKLIIEALPGYMFIQPTKEPKPEKDHSPQLSGKELEDYCSGKCMGYSDFYGMMMLDMGCYARCVGDI